MSATEDDKRVAAFFQPCKSFDDGLKPSMAAWVRYNNPKTVEDAFHIAIQFESLQNQSNKSVTFFTTHASEEGAGKIDYFYCNTPGHAKYVCRKRLRELDQGRVRSQSNRFSIEAVKSSAVSVIAPVT